LIAYKFLRHGRVGPFSRFQWPGAGVWVQTESHADVCRRGIHACRTRDLPWWLADELWEIELEGDVAAHEHKLVAQAGRLVSRVARWTPECAQEYGKACAWRARDRAVEALARRGHREAAAQLAAAPQLDAVLTRTRLLIEEAPEVRISLTIAGDGAVRALSGPPPTSAYIAAHAAHRLDGPAGYAAERAWQARWLVDRLGLRA
jgi:hypothetical protein